MFKKLKKFIQKQASTAKEKAQNAVVKFAHKTLSDIKTEYADDVAAALFYNKFDAGVEITNGKDFSVSGSLQGLTFSKRGNGKTGLTVMVKLNRVSRKG